MQVGKVVGREEWLAARKALLEEEKAFNKARDALTAKRQALPWVKVEKDYRFHDDTGELGLAGLFQGKSQLLIYHFMFGPDWEQGCPSCSFWADTYNGAVEHLAAIDIGLAAVSNTAYEKLDGYRRRMGWSFRWVSSLGSDFNRDFHVTFTEEEIADGKAEYNYGVRQFPVSEAPGVSIFAHGDDDAIYHTYSTYARGLDMLNGAYHMIDLTPKGRASEKEHGIMHWVQRRDQYRG